MNAVASGLIEAIKLAINGATPPYSASNYPPTATGTDWDYIPTGSGSWYKYGAGGIMHWGTVCGVPNGCAAVLNLMNLATSAYVDQIMCYFSQTEFPSKDLYEDIYSDPDYQYLFGGKIPQPYTDVRAFTTSDSPLCHISISKWCWAAGLQMNDMGTQSITHKVDRCAKMAGDTAAFTAGLLNALTADYHIPEETEACYACHSASATTATAKGPAQQGHMDCGECHTDLRAHAVTGYPPTVGHTPDPVNVAGMVVSFTDDSHDNNGNPQNTLGVEINWGDGGMSKGVGGGSFSHTYAGSGKYTITHSVQDSGGRFASEIIKVAVGMYSLTVHVIQDGGTPVAGATVYLKQKKGSGDWKQIMYGYTDDTGFKTYTDLPGTGYQYKVVVYKSGFDFNTSATGTQTKVASTAFGLTADTTVTIQQGGPPVVTIA